MYQWLLDMYDNFADLSTSDDKDTRLNPSLLPGWAYARALVLRLMEDTTKEKVSLPCSFLSPDNILVSQTRTKSVLALQQAAQDFPSVIPLLADKLDVTLASNIRAHKDFKIETDNMCAS